jgi:hypothetical protein
MGKVLTVINFWDCDWKVKEVISASTLDLFNIKNLKEVSNRPCVLHEVDNGTFYLEFRDKDQFIEFK